MKNAALAALLLVAACRTSLPPSPAPPGAIHGRIEGIQGVPKKGEVQVYRLDGNGQLTLPPFESVAPDRLGRFTTHTLGPGRYRLAYRSGDGPPSIGTGRVPSDTVLALRPMVVAGLADLHLSTAQNTAGPIRFRLTEADPPDDIADVREAVCAPFAPAFLRDVRPGRWRVDIPETGATTEILVPRGDGVAQAALDPPPIDAGGTLTGRVVRLDGGPAAYVVVTARPVAELGAPGSAWGRFGMTDHTGAYSITGIPEGSALVRVECREVRYRILPSALEVRIPPSGRVELSFVVEP